MSEREIFVLGVFLGAITVIICQFLEKRLNLWLERQRLELDLTLGRDLQKMKDKLNEP
jgi:hypothetical protein